MRMAAWCALKDCARAGAQGARYSSARTLAARYVPSGRARGQSLRPTGGCSSPRTAPPAHLGVFFFLPREFSRFTARSAHAVSSCLVMHGGLRALY